MRSLFEILRRIAMDLLSKYDVIVAGGGPAGICAAIAAGREGASTVLIERYGFLGGMSTAALVYPQEIVDRLVERGESPGHLRDTVGFTHTLTPFQPEAFKLLALEMLREANVTLLLHSFIDNVHVENDNITAIEVTGKSGRIKIFGKVFIDCTGDADLVALSGAPFQKGRAEDGLTQPMTLKFRLRNVDVDQIKAYMIENPDEFVDSTPIAELPHLPLTGVAGFNSIWQQGKLSINRQNFLFFIGPEPDEVLVNSTRVQGLDPTNIEHLSEAEEIGRKQVLELLHYMKAHLPGFNNAVLSHTGTQIGVRESRRLEGLYSLTMEDVVSARPFPDAIAHSGYPIDVHAPTGSGIISAWPDGGGAYDIPYRCLVSSKIHNLLAAGRCISTTHEALGTTRLTPSCMATGEAAGVAATLAAQGNKPVKDIDVNELRNKLRTSGAYLK